MSLASTLHVLADYRAHSTRASQDVLEKGIEIVNKGRVSKLGDEEWAFREQLLLAALDLRELDVADDCLRELQQKFPESPRVNVLVGIRMEATASPEVVLQYYDQLLEADAADGAAWKRKVSVLRRMGKAEKAVEELSSYLDTFYTDVEGWLELADIYCTCNQYLPALQALSHAMIIAPQNPFHILQFAETAYTANDVPLAMKIFLIVIEKCDEDGVDTNSVDSLTIRAWWGINLCCYRFLRTLSCPSASNTLPPNHVEKLHELAVERILAAYSTHGRQAEGKAVVVQWLQTKLAA